MKYWVMCKDNTNSKTTYNQMNSKNKYTQYYWLKASIYPCVYNNIKLSA